MVIPNVRGYGNIILVVVDLKDYPAKKFPLAIMKFIIHKGNVRETANICFKIP